MYKIAHLFFENYLKKLISIFKGNLEIYFFLNNFLKKDEQFFPSLSLEITPNIHKNICYRVVYTHLKSAFDGKIITPKIKTA